jgi:iron complex transport system substrate-binding protein
MRFSLLLLTALFIWPYNVAAREVTDALERKVAIPETVERVICSGSGCLRLLTYLQAQDLAIAVDDLEGTPQKFDARPYAMANPHFKELPVFGKLHGEDDPELIKALDPLPQVILKIIETGGDNAGQGPDDLQKKTGIPVIALKEGDFYWLRQDLFATLRTMANVVGRQKRAEEVVSYLEGIVADLKKRTQDIPEDQRRSVYLGGVAFAGQHGFVSTEPSSTPFQLANARNVAQDADPNARGMNNADVAKDQIIAWDPEYIFLDLSTLQLGDEAGALYELKTDKTLQTLSAVRTGQVYGTLPCTWYGQNYDTLLANAYFIGKLLYPDRFIDIDPATTADEIYSFMVGKAVYADLNSQFQDLVFRRVPLQ